MKPRDAGYPDLWDRYDDPPYDDVDPCATCGRWAGGELMPCPCGCQKNFHKRCAAECFACKWPVCEKSVVTVGEEQYCTECAPKARAEIAAFDPNKVDPGAAERGDRARAGFQGRQDAA